MAGVYIHIPFCRRRCPYCDFVSQATPDTVPEAYIQALLNEIRQSEAAIPVESIFFGGGTPSLLPPSAVARLLDALSARLSLASDAEITAEANPDDISPELVQRWRLDGVNRISLGVQSFSDAALRYLGRRHDAAKARRAVTLIAEAYSNWNIDLIFGAPPLDAWSDVLEEALAFQPPHIALYGLTYEPGTPFGAQADEAVDDDTSLALYEEAERRLADSYDHYEISNWARPGRQCRHNLIYWHNEEYLGFGTGAYGFINGVRMRKYASHAAYMENPLGKEESLALTPEEIRVETVIQHLRLRAGLPKAYYQQRFGRAIDDDFGPALTLLAERGLIENTGDTIIPTAEGFYLNNEIGLALLG